MEKNKTLIWVVVAIVVAAVAFGFYYYNGKSGQPAGEEMMPAGGDVGSGADAGMETGEVSGNIDADTSSGDIGPIDVPVDDLNL